MKKIFSSVLIPLSGLIGGLLCGLLGTGGGVIIVFALRLAQRSAGGDEKSSYFSAMCATMIFSLVSIAKYAAAGAVNLRDAAIFIPAAALGGFAGAKIAERISTELLNRIFAAVLIFAGGSMLLRAW